MRIENQTKAAMYCRTKAGVMIGHWSNTGGII